MNTIQTQINELEKRISAKVENVDLSPLETAVAENTANISANTTAIETNATNIATNTTNILANSASIETLETSMDICLQSIETIETNIATLETAVDANTANIAENAGDISALETAVAGNTTGIASLETAVAGNTSDIATNTANISTNTTAIATNTTAIANHETRISVLEMPDFYGTTNAEITALKDKVLTDERYNHNGGTAKLNMGTKGVNGPFATIFTRINPMENPHYVGELKLFMANIPSGQTTTSLNLIINGESTALTPTFVEGEEYNLLISFDFYTSSVSNVFKIQFTDILLASTILEYIEITATTGVNFEVLNRDNSYRLQNFFQKTSDSKTYWYSTQIVNYGAHGENASFSNIASPNYYTPCTIQEGDYLRDNSVSYMIFLSSGVYYYYTAPRIECQLVNEDSTLRTFETSFLNRHTVKTNVNHFDYSFNNGSLNTTEIICGTTLNQELFLVRSRHNSIEKDIKLNGNYFPSEFIQLNAITDFWVIRQTVYFQAGYIAVHNTGTIVYIPDANSTYFIVIGKGTQPNAYVQQNRTLINVYYNYNGKAIRKQLGYNSTTQKWELLTDVEIYPTATEVIEKEYSTTLQKTILIGKVNGTWQLI